MELAVTKGTTRTTGASRGCCRNAKPSCSSSPSSSASSWGLSGRVGVRVLMHRDQIACRFFRSLPRAWLKKYWGRPGKKSDEHPHACSSPPHRPSSPFPLSSPPLSSHSSSVSSHYFCSLVSHLSSPALKERDREREQPGSASSQALDGQPGYFSTPGMTNSQWGPSTQLTATNTTSSSASLAPNFGQSLRHHNSSGWVFFFSSSPLKDLFLCKIAFFFHLCTLKKLFPNDGISGLRSSDITDIIVRSIIL